MKRQVVFYLSLAFASFMTSCSSNDVINEAYEANEVRKIWVSAKNIATDDSETSRTAIDWTNGFSWNAGDSIGIFPTQGAQLPFAITESGAGTSKAAISGGSWGLKLTTQYAAYYPFDKQNYFSDRNSILFDYTGQVQTGFDETAHLGKYDLMAAKNAVAQNDILNFEFSHIGCFLKIHATIPAAGTYSSLSLEADEPAFSSVINLDLTGTDIEITPVEKVSSIKLRLKEFTTTSDNQTVLFCMACAPFDLAGETVTLKLFSANGYTYTGTVTPSKAYTSSTAYNMRFGTLTKSSTPSVGIGGEFETSESEM